MVDKDSTYSFSNIISIRRNKTDVPYLLYPNPVNEVINYHFNSDISENIVLEIFDMLGRTVTLSEQTTTPGSNLIKMNTAILPAGVYSLRISHQTSGITHSTKIIKNKP